MSDPNTQAEALPNEIARLRRELHEAQLTINAIRAGQIDAVVIDAGAEPHVSLLEAGERSYRILVEQMNEGAASLAVDGTLLFANRQLAHMLGQEAGALAGRHLRSLCLVGEIPGLEYLFKAALLAPQKGELHLERPGKAPLPVLVSLSPFEIDAIPLVGAVFTDLTERKLTDELIASERLANAILDQAADAMVVCDKSLRILRASESSTRLAAEGVYNRPFTEAFDLIPAAGAPAPDLLRVLNGASIEVLECELRKGERNKNVLLSARPLAGLDGSVVGCVVSMVDVTHLKAAERELALSAKVFESSREGICITDRQRVPLQVNPAFERITGWSRAELGERALDICGLGSPGRWDEIRPRLLVFGRWEGEFDAVQPDGQHYQAWLSVSAVAGADGTPSHYIFIISNISERKQAEERIAFMANYDPLTGLPNRKSLVEQLARAIESVRRSGRLLGLLCLDLDQFRNVNDSFGHAVGDSVLKAIATRLTKAAGRDQLCARLSGDEFGVIIGEAEAVHTISHLADKLIRSIQKPLKVCGTHIDISVTVGIAVFPHDADDGDALLQCATLAMNAAKQRRRGGALRFAEDMRSSSRDRLLMEHELRKALREHQFELYYQPKLELASGAIIGAEALIRWNHPHLGVVPPAVFFPVAEEAGLLTAISDWAVEAAVRQVAAWRNAPMAQLKIAVNITSQQIEREEFLERPAALLKKYGVHGGRIEIELTESSLLRRKEHVAKMLLGLERLGIAVAIDDFGTGYSSLNYIGNFKVGTLKIDQSFVRALPDNGEGVAIVQAIVAFAKALKLCLVAEGVETEAQKAFLRYLGVEYWQGYLFNRPVSAGEFEACVAGHAPERWRAAETALSPGP